jgi:hypothetical protein
MAYLRGKKGNSIKRKRKMLSLDLADFINPPWAIPICQVPLSGKINPTIFLEDS